MGTLKRGHKIGLGSLALIILALVAVPNIHTVPFPQADQFQAQCLPVSRPDPANIKRPSGDVVLKTIRLTDDGELVDRCEWTDVLDEVRWVSNPQVILLYVHGWKHNADERDGDRQSFQSFLRAVRGQEEVSGQPRQVVGIYLAWNGLSTEGFLKQLSFWSRKRAADRISQSAIVTKLVGAIRNARRLENQPRDLTVFIGHSFGARILFTATSQQLLYEVQLHHPGGPGTYSRIRGPANAILLLNPAFEASIYTPFDAHRRVDYRFDKDQPPLTVTISTTNDLATGWAFPIGQLFDWLTMPREVLALGHYAPYFTHRLGSNLQRPATPLSWYDDFCTDSGTCLELLNDNAFGRNPFISATAGPDLLDGHNGIWRPTFRQWLLKFVEALDKHRVTEDEAVVS